MKRKNTKTVYQLEISKEIQGKFASIGDHILIELSPAATINFGAILTSDTQSSNNLKRTICEAFQDVISVREIADSLKFPIAGNFGRPMRGMTIRKGERVTGEVAPPFIELYISWNTSIFSEGVWVGIIEMPGENYIAEGTIKPELN